MANPPPPYSSACPNPPPPQQGVRQIYAPAPGPQYMCAHCGQLFAYYLTSGVTKCPHCHRVNVIGNWARTRGIIYLIVGILFILAAIAVTVGTLAGGGGFYYVWIGGYGFGILFIIRSILFFSLYKQAQRHGV